MKYLNVPADSMDYLFPWEGVHPIVTIQPEILVIQPFLHFSLLLRPNYKITRTSYALRTRFDFILFQAGDSF
jgi:hypothetical protein